jgi:dihydroorotase
MEISRISGNAVLPTGVRPATIVLKQGVITEILDTDEKVPKSELIFPGFIDIHVHAREYPRPAGDDQAALGKWDAACRKETFATAGNAAVNGGVTLFAAMPNDQVPPSDAASYSLKAGLTTSSPCPVILFAAVTRSSEPWADLPYKVYLDSKPSSVSFTSWNDAEETLVRYRGRSLFFHAEDPDILEQCTAIGPRWKSRPAEAEITAVERILELTAKLGLRSHICHVSTEKAVRLIQEYNRLSSDRVTCEVTPHHLFFSVNEGEISCAGSPCGAMADLLECNPPLRSENDRRFLIDALRKGAVDILATDHAPHTLDDKAAGAPGMPHLDTLGAFACWLSQECGFSPIRIAEILATKPAEIMSNFLEHPQGTIEVGNRASLTVLDSSGSTLVHGSEIVDRGTLKTRCGWSPFSGIQLPGAVRRTVVCGRSQLFG